jgi:hypothetical protein
MIRLKIGFRRDRSLGRVGIGEEGSVLQGSVGRLHPFAWIRRTYLLFTSLSRLNKASSRYCVSFTCCRPVNFRSGVLPASPEGADVTTSSPSEILMKPPSDCTILEEAGVVDGDYRIVVDGQAEP